MIRGLFTILLCLCVTTVLLVQAGLALLTPAGRIDDWLQVLVARQLADTLGREVRIGRIEGDWLTRVVASDVAVGEGASFADGVLLSARKVRIDYNLLAIVRREVAPAVAVDKVVVEGGWARVVRDPHGVINLSTLFPRRKPAPPEEAFQGVVEIVDSDISYVDYEAHARDGRPLELELGGISGQVDMRRLGWVQIKAEAWERLGHVDYLQADIEGNAEAGVWWIGADVSGADIAWWYNFYYPVPGVTVNRASADVSGVFLVGPTPDGGRRAGLTAHARLSDASVRLAALNNRLITGEAECSVSLKGLQVQRLDAWMGDTHVRAEGSLSDFSDPCLDVTFDVQAPHPERLTEIAPGVTDYLNGLDMDGPLLASGALLGSPGSCNLLAEVTVPGDVAFAAGGVEGRAHEITAEVNLFDISQPNVWARATLGTFAADMNEPGTSGDGAGSTWMAGGVSAGPMENVTVEAIWAPENPIAQTRLHLPQVRVGGVRASDVDAELTLAGGTVSVRDARFKALGGEIHADGVVDLAAEDGPWVYVSGGAQGLDLARVDELPGVNLGEE
ncbi:MAG: hypothetical protein J7M38_07175, partial [Armatimonadetes bacterium]|nr:hypothetical protein [Armatimonadota bacterium]